MHDLYGAFGRRHNVTLPSWRCMLLVCQNSFGQSQFVLLLQRRTHCIIKNVFKVYLVKPASNNLGYYRVVKAYFIYDHREEHVYQ